MNLPLHTADAQAEPELFPYMWLTSRRVWDVINAAPVGISLLQALRSDDADLIDDFQYVFVNPVQEAMIKLLADDIVGQPLTMISPDVTTAGVLDRLRQVVETGQPATQIEAYQLDGITGLFCQVYLKSGDGVLLLVQDVSFRPLSAAEQQQQTALLTAIHNRISAAHIRAMLIALISGQLF
ncbi:PAS domain-containing protein [Fibrella sp. HMF5335]|uniref:PAS domain-containing protein n=1 Tax=Fibrella rubiginis TaxID=2817060 RepID=A0A939GFU7_9BACT|nr:PAS domain-containing protein [Fibrella rubiginis]MBO0936015.1 PAS domain-containing protein [Fibrella rubiginis]